MGRRPRNEETRAFAGFLLYGDIITWEMKRFSEYLIETTLARIWDHACDPNQNVGIISAFRHENTPAINLDRTHQLAGMIRQAGYGFIFVEGHYIEEGSVKVDETSIFVIGRPGPDGAILRGQLRQWRDAFEQESALFKPAGGDHAYLLNANGTTIDVGRLHPNQTGMFMSQLHGRGDRPFIFESAFIG